MICFVSGSVPCDHSEDVSRSSRNYSIIWYLVNVTDVSHINLSHGPLVYMFNGLFTDGPGDGNEPGPPGYSEVLIS